MQVFNHALKYLLSGLAVTVMLALTLHTLQIPHQHFISFDYQEINHFDHNHESANSKNNTHTDQFTGLSDYLHGSDKKDILSLLLSLAYLAGLLFISWPATIWMVLIFKAYEFKIATSNPPFVSYLKLFLSLGIINPKLH